MHKIFSDFVATLSEFKEHPVKLMDEADGNPVAVFDHNEPLFYCISPKMLASFITALDDAELVKIINARQGEDSVEVSLNDL
jgi:antitoxin StbD